MIHGVEASLPRKTRLESPKITKKASCRVLIETVVDVICTASWCSKHPINPNEFGSFQTS